MLKSAFSNFFFDKKAIIFAITNVCNYKCEMCSIWKQKNKRMVKLDEAKKVLIKLYKNNFGTIQITGGEPLLNPDVFSIINFAKKLNFLVFLVSNGSLINESVAHKLSVCGVDNFGISFHHYDETISEKIFNHKNILSKTINSIKCLKKENIPTEALFTLSKYNENDIEKIVDYINSFDIGVSFCIPTIVKETSYSLGGNCMNFSREELKNKFLEIIRLKKKGYNIVNNMIFLKEVVDFLEGKNRHYCLGGYKIFYLDWNLDLYPCMIKGQNMLIDEVNFNFENEKCNKCLLQCFREPSLFLLSKSLALKLILQELPNYSKLIKRR